MPSTGTAIFPGASTFPGTGVYPGQGPDPVAVLLYSTSDAQAAPVWSDATPKLRAYSTSRGRENELADIDAGTMTVTLDDRDRTFDPTANAAIRPMNRWWLREQFSGETHSVFTGYAESYQEQWVNGAEEAATVVACVDEFKVLALAKLPATDPPRGSYQELVMFDQPRGYWPMDNDAGAVAAATGEPLGAIGATVTAETDSAAIVGQQVGGYTYVTGVGYLQTAELLYAQSGDAGGLAEFALETWLAIDGTPSGTELLMSGPQGIPSHTYTWKLSLNTSRQLVLQAKNTGGTVHTATSTTALTSAAIGSNIWYHVVGTITGGSLRLYVNGVQEASTAWTGTFEFLDNANYFIVGNAGTTIGANVRAFDEMAFYRHGLEAARVAAHYTAGTERGFPTGQRASERIVAVLDAAENTVPRSIRVATKGTMIATYMVGQSLLEEIRNAESTEPVNGVFFVSRDGTLTYLDDDHRTVSPWNTVQATFDDDGTDFAYQDLTMDYSDAFLVNEWNVNVAAGTVETRRDDTSIAVYGLRSQTLAGIPLEPFYVVGHDVRAQLIAIDMLAKYKDPMRRVTRLELFSSNADVIDNLLRRDIGDRLRVFRTPPGGGSRIDQTVFIQKISVTGVPGQPRRIVLGLSPL